MHNISAVKELKHALPNSEEDVNQQVAPTQVMPSMFVPFTLERMPFDIKNMIFAHAANPVEYQDGLLALAKTSKPMRSTVVEFMRNDENGKRISTILRCGPPSLWRTRGQEIIENSKTFRKDFVASAGSVFNNAAMKLTGDMASGALTRFKAIEFNLNKFDFSAEDCGQIIQNVVEQIGSIRNKPVKINAGAFKGERHILEIIVHAALTAVHFSCPVMLDLSNNKLEDTDLLPLIQFIKKKPIIYKLNLDENRLCTGNQPSLALPELFQIMTPLSHLYLRKTGFNDATALSVHEALGQHPCLIALDLRSNLLTAAGALPLIKAVGSKHKDGSIHANTTLQALRLQNNHFGNGISLAAATDQADRIWRKAKPDSFDKVYPDVVQLQEINIFTRTGYPFSDSSALYSQQLADQAAEDQKI